jgi:Icc-related predicted phosphoesterase
MIITCIADQHMYLPEIDECDLLVIAGDICNFWALQNPEMQVPWFEVAVKPWLESVPAKEIVFVPGNHDLIFNYVPKNRWPDLRWRMLIDEELTLETEGGPLKVYGTPWTRRAGDLAFNKDPVLMREVAKKIPRDTDILICHQQPIGLLGGNKQGCPFIAHEIEQVKPKLVVCGHAHGCYGLYKQPYGGLIVNAAITNELKRAPIRLDYWMI